VLSRQQKHYDEGYLSDVRSGLNDDDDYCLDCGNHECTCDDDAGDDMTYQEPLGWDGFDD